MLVTGQLYAGTTLHFPQLGGRVIKTLQRANVAAKSFRQYTRAESEIVTNTFASGCSSGFLIWHRGNKKLFSRLK